MWFIYIIKKNKSKINQTHRTSDHPIKEVCSELALSLEFPNQSRPQNKKRKNPKP